MIRELIAKCPDRETESVIADWCEENGRRELATWLRGASTTRASALEHLSNTLEEPRITEASFRSMLAIVRNLPHVGREWLTWSDALMEPEAPPQRDHRFFVRELQRLEGDELGRVGWAFARELVTTPNAGIPKERLVPLADIVTVPCPTCHRPGPVIGCEHYRVDGAGDNSYWTDCFVLCFYEPHVAKIGSTEARWDGASV